MYRSCCCKETTLPLSSHPQNREESSLYCSKDSNSVVRFLLQETCRHVSGCLYRSIEKDERLMIKTSSSFMKALFLLDVMFVYFKCNISLETYSRGNPWGVWGSALSCPWLYWLLGFFSTVICETSLSELNILSKSSAEVDQTFLKCLLWQVLH